MLVVGDFLGSIDAGDGLERFLSAIVGFGAHGDRFFRFQRRDAFDGEGFVAGEAERFASLAGFEFEGQNAHADEIAAVNSLVAFGNDGADAEKARALGGPVA